MARITVWDYPVRIFHWIFVVCFFSAIGLAEFAPEHSQLFDLHMLIGLILAPVVILRILWGLIGTKHARFQSFVYRPKEVYDYLISIVTLKGRRYLGHNPAASYAAFAMIILALSIVATGLLMRRGEIFEEAHGVVAYVMLTVVAIHICGVILHVARHKENIIFSMFSGTKEGEEKDSIPSAKPVIGMIFLVLVVGWAIIVFRGYDRQTQRVEIPLFGINIQLGEGEDS